MSGKIDILEKSQGKFKQFNTAELIPSKAGKNIWGLLNLLQGSFCFLVIPRVIMISTIFLCDEEREFVENLSVLIKSGKEDCEMRVEFAIISDILQDYLVREILFLS